MITSKQRAKLKSISHNIKPIINIGKNGISDNLMIQINDLLEAREIIKIKILSNNLDKSKNLINSIIKETNSEFIQFLGNIITIYRKSKKNQKIEL